MRVLKEERQALEASEGAVEPALVSLRSVGKAYRLYERPQDRLRHSLLWRFGKTYGRDFWALRDVSFEVRRGETFGIIGRNGSGKSTLLQLMAGTLRPTSGEIRVEGKVAALLELGSGFSPDFTGRENAFLNGALLGLSRAEVAERFDQIAAFAEIGDFMDQPVRMYSAGMYLRLAFAVAMHADPDLFVIDEALAVGDIFFQARCSEKLRDYAHRGGTIVLVSHDVYAVERLCDRALVLDHGQMLHCGSVEEAINLYYAVNRMRSVTDGARGVVADEQPGRMITNGKARITRVKVTDTAERETTEFPCGEEMIATAVVTFDADLDHFHFGIGLRDRNAFLIGGAHTFYSPQRHGPVRVGETVTISARIRLAVQPAEYVLFVGASYHYSLEHWEDLCLLPEARIIRVTGHALFWGQCQLPHVLTVEKATHARAD